MSCNREKPEFSSAKLKMANGFEADTIEELREHFDLIALLEHYSSGELLKWLSGRYPFEAELVGSLDQSMDNFEEDLCSIFQVSFSLDDAVDRFREAAENGNAEGQFRLGCYCMFGIGVEENKALAVEWIRKAAEQGHVAAQYELGVDYMEGHGVAVDEPEAVRWIRAAAENGNIDAQLNMGVFYDIGQGVEPDREESIRWFEMAADSGDIEALHWLGGKYWFNDDEKAFHYFKLAAEAGHPGSMFYLAHFYMNGNVVEIDEKEAVRLLRESAECGHGEAAEVLEDMGL